MISWSVTWLIIYETDLRNKTCDHICDLCNSIWYIWSLYFCHLPSYFCLSVCAVCVRLHAAVTANTLLACLPPCLEVRQWAGGGCLAVLQWDPSGHALHRVLLVDMIIIGYRQRSRLLQATRWAVALEHHCDKRLVCLDLDLSSWWQVPDWQFKRIGLDVRCAVTRRIELEFGLFGLQLSCMVPLVCTVQTMQTVRNIYIFPSVIHFFPQKAHFPHTPSHFSHMTFQSLGYVMKHAAAFRVCSYTRIG